LVPWGNNDYAYFYASDITPGAMNVSVGSAGVSAQRITLQSGGGDLSINNNTVTLIGGPNLAGYCLLRNETANNMIFNSVIAGSAGLYMGYSMGSGSVVLGANNTYSGGTMVGNGRLVIQNGVNATGSGDVAVTNDPNNTPNNSSYVGGLTWNTTTATIGGSVVVSSSSPSLIAQLGPSSGVSALHIGGSLTFGPNSEPVLALSSAYNGANDQVAVGSSLNGGGVRVGIQCGATLDTAHDYVLFISGGVTGSFNSTPIWTATTPQYASQYSIINSGTQVHLHYTPAAVPCSQTNAIVGIADNHNGTFTISFLGTPQAQYYVAASPDMAAPTSNWVPLAGSTNTVTNGSGQWQLTVTNTASQQYYRSRAVVPCP
jgi:autotransporter-associated beta strand protein